MNTNIKTNKTLLVGILAVLLVAILSLALVACNTQESKTETVATTQENEKTNGFSAETTSTQYIKLAMSEAMTTAESGSVSKTITATVLPITAVNKSVDWSVEWGDSSNTATVTDYITVIPDSDGNTSATVTCYQAFTGNIIVTVTTRENGYTASCVVSFAGIPTDMNISGSVSPSGANNTYDLGVGKTFIFDVGMTNQFNSVGSNYNNISCTFSGVGSINVGYMEHNNSSGANNWYETNNKVLTVDSLKNSFISASYSNGKLTIVTLKTIESYYGSVRSIDSGRTRAYTDKFRSYVDDCYFTVTLNEATSGISKTMIIRFDDSVVTGVSASVSEIVF